MHKDEKMIISVRGGSRVKPARMHFESSSMRVEYSRMHVEPTRSVLRLQCRAEY
jgi:hypothetical protein